MARTLFRVAVAILLVATASHAAVLCTSHSGSGTVRVRVACKTNEVQLDPVALGLQGPPGKSVEVRDASGQLVGITGHTALRSGTFGTGQILLINRVVGAATLTFLVTQGGFVDTFSELLYETGDCTGPAYVRAESGYMIAYTEVRGTTVYYPSGLPAARSIRSYLQCFTGPKDNCCVPWVADVVGAVASAVDLTTFGLVPPFHVEGP